MLKTVVMLFGVMLLTACTGMNVPRTDTVANVCEDLGLLFREGLESRIAGATAPVINKVLSEKVGVSDEVATQVTAAVLAQVLPRVRNQERWLTEAQTTMNEACKTAQGYEAVTVVLPK